MHAHPFRPGDDHVIVPDLTPSEPPFRPPMHWGATVKNLSLDEAFSLAWGMLQRTGFQIEHEPSRQEPIVIGFNRKAIAFVVVGDVGDGRSDFLVAAISSDSPTAEQARNDIRTEIDKSFTL